MSKIKFSDYEDEIEILDDIEETKKKVNSSKKSKGKKTKINTFWKKIKKLNKKNKNKPLILLGSFLLLMIVVSIVLVNVTNIFDDKKESSKNNNNSNETNETMKEEEKEPEKKLSIVNLEDKRRPYAVMINNHHAAWPQAGLSDAYLIYEIMVEGGITRMLALFTQDKDVEKIGSIRSARHNYLDYAMENDAIYVHFGWSYVAEEHIPKLGINHIDGNTFASKYFYRDKNLNRSTEHTVFTTSDSIKEAIENYKYRNERNKDYLLNYTTDIVDLSKYENSQVASRVSVKYSYYQTSSYEYNEEEQVYYRTMGNTKHTDLVTGEQYKFKNIIVYSVQYNSYEGSILQDLQNIGTGEGYYITNGYAIPIIWEKTKREGETIYKYQDGSEIDVSDGNTFIQIYPSNGGSVTIN